MVAGFGETEDVVVVTAEGQTDDDTITDKALFTEASDTEEHIFGC